jgi:hypothetical protein
MDAWRRNPARGESRPLPWRLLSGLVAIRLGLYLLSSGPLAYGTMSDEFYYIDCAERLAWGYVDHPPFSIAVLAASRSLLGDSRLALRLVPALLGCALILLSALTARELGGGRAAQSLAALSTLVAPVFLAVTGFYSMNAFEPALWAVAVLLIARIVNGGNPSRLWPPLGIVLGLALLNKISTLWFGAGIGVGLVLTRERRWLATRWPWLCFAIALLLFSPHIFWQLQNGWPTLEFMHNAATQKMLSKSPLTIALDQLLAMNPALAPFWLAGLAWYFVAAEGERFQWLAWIWITVLLILLATGSARANYLAPAYAALLPAGGVAFERIARARAWRWLPAAAAVAFVVTGAGEAPLAIDLLPPREYKAYERAIGVSAPVDQIDELGPMPLHFALRFGWPELIGAVERAHATLSPSERERAVVFGALFGDTAAVNFLGRARGLPRAISGHNSYWLWGPEGATGEVLLALAGSDERLREWYEDVRRVAEIDCEYCMPGVARMGVYVCRRPRRPIAQWWPEAKIYQ